jgi:hypothetical protein
LAELDVVGVAEGWEADAKVLCVGTAERVEANEAGEVEVVVEADDVAHGVVLILLSH